MSEHEGFCVPLIEAMHFGVPIVAFDAGAVADTIGEGGIVLARKAPAETAELMSMLLERPALREELRQAGKARVESFREPAFRSHLDRLILQPLRSLEGAQAQCSA